MRPYLPDHEAFGAKKRTAESTRYAKTGRTKITAYIAARTAYIAARDAAIAAHSEAEQATAAKQEALQSLADDIRRNLRYAEMIVDFDDAKLKSIGWGGRRERTPLTPPGQVTGLVIVAEGEGWITLRWNKPRAARQWPTRSCTGNGSVTGNGRAQTLPPPRRSRWRVSHGARNWNTA
uniref:Uncharacterized protein n=1 Tax=Candidatus Kentrum sp. TUN TaxID=2126343 RepID=A0A450ZLX7_9GAMM|nr:MAG: hypothetical protein BECKTUN1418F_GA0071002_10547 [Candidatus Kentron sp. TUN]VFK59587.1 MAG: hypothetical protein BECKTUN1418E_GA0071001_10547 [Candidatus Kentron sp. TUN]